VNSEVCTQRGRFVSMMIANGDMYSKNLCQVNAYTSQSDFCLPIYHDAIDWNIFQKRR